MFTCHFFLPISHAFYVCSMRNRRDYYNPAQATYLLNCLFAWLLLEACDKRCVGRLFGSRESADTPAAEAKVPLAPVLHGRERLTWSHAVHSTLQRACRPLLQLLSWVLPSRWWTCLAAGPEADTLSTPERRRQRTAAEHSTARTTARSRSPRPPPKQVTSGMVACSGWSLRIVDGMPGQRDDVSCGVFMTAFALAVLQGKPPESAMWQAEVPAMRRAIAASLLHLDSGNLLRAQ